MTPASAPGDRPRVTELALPLEPCTRDSFIDDLEPAADPHRRQVALVRASLLASSRRDRPTHRRSA